MAVEPLPNGVRQINIEGLELVKEFEGFASRMFRSGPRRGQIVPNGGVTAYFDPVRVPTIGYGNTPGTSPSQGNDGGAYGGNNAGAGGGGAH
jgi:GH24 family phage-related lysozyme (muramidase)